MRISSEWLDGGINAALEERATLSAWQLFVADQNVCLHLDQGESSDHIISPLYSIAEGLSHDWWSIFGGRDCSVSIASHRMGFAVPDVRLKFDGSAFEITAEQKSYVNPNVRFWAGPTETMDRSTAENALSSLIGIIIDRLNEKGIRGSAAQLRWARVETSRQSEDESAFCEAAGALGIDPYSIPEETADLIEQSASLFAGEALVEFLGGLRSRPQRAREAIDWVNRVERRPRYHCRLPELRGAAQRVCLKAPAKDEQAWSLGYRRARAFRAELDWGPNDRIRTHKAVAERLGAPNFALAESVEGLTALRSDKDDGVYLHVRRQGRTSAPGHAFAFARGIGDAVCFPSHDRAPINELHEARRQAAGRAFAAEFLAPVDEVLALRAEGRDTATIASEFGVAVALVDRQIENAARIRNVCT